MFVLARGGERARLAVNAREFRALAERSRDLQRVAVWDDIREQLRQWAEDFDDEAEAIEKVTDRSASARSTR
jgi:hypothetical protein